MGKIDVTDPVWLAEREEFFRSIEAAYDPAQRVDGRRACRYLPVSEAAEVYERLTGRAISVGTVRRYIRDGRLQALQPGGGVYLVRVQDIEDARLTPTRARRFLREYWQLNGGP